MAEDCRFLFKKCRNFHPPGDKEKYYLKKQKTSSARQAQTKPQHRGKMTTLLIEADELEVRNKDKVRRDKETPCASGSRCGDMFTTCGFLHSIEDFKEGHKNATERLEQGVESTNIEGEDQEISDGTRFGPFGEGIFSPRS